MARMPSARRYAQAAFEIAREGDEVEGWGEDLAVIAQRLGYPELRPLLENPKLPFREKMELVKLALPDVGPLALNLAFLLVAKGRLGLIEGILGEYQRLWDGYRGVERAEVAAAIPLGDEVVERLSQRLSQVMAKKVLLKTRVDPELLGGLWVRIGDRLIDGSLRGRLDELRRNLGGGI